MGVFADALAAAMNPSCAGGNHAAIYLERQVIGWFREMLGFPPEAMGLLVSGGSMATLTALAVARHVKSGVDVRTRRPARRAATVRVLPDPRGSRVRPQGGRAAGIWQRVIRTVPPAATTAWMSARSTPRCRRIAAEGCAPIAVVATAGTVNTGAIDALDAIARRLRAPRHMAARRRGVRRAGDPRRRDMRDRASRARRGRQRRPGSTQVAVRAGGGGPRVRARRRGDARAFSLVPPYLRTDGTRPGWAGRPGSASSASSRRAASAR